MGLPRLAEITQEWEGGKYSSSHHANHGVPVVEPERDTTYRCQSTSRMSLLIIPTWGAVAKRASTQKEMLRVRLGRGDVKET